MGISGWPSTNGYKWWFSLVMLVAMNHHTCCIPIIPNTCWLNFSQTLPLRLAKHPSSSLIKRHRHDCSSAIKRQLGKSFVKMEQVHVKHIGVSLCFCASYTNEASIIHFWWNHWTAHFLLVEWLYHPCSGDNETCFVKWYADWAQVSGFPRIFPYKYRLVVGSTVFI